MQRAEKKKDDSALVAEEMAEGDEHTQDVADKVDDMQKAQKKEQQKKNDEFNRVPDEIKTEMAGDILGADFLQLSSRMGIKHNIMKNIRKVSLAQLSTEDDKVFGASEEPAKDGEQSIADLTSNAKEEIKNSISNDAKKEEPKKE